MTPKEFGELFYRMVCIWETRFPDKAWMAERQAEYYDSLRHIPKNELSRTITILRDDPEHGGAYMPKPALVRQVWDARVRVKSATANPGEPTEKEIARFRRELDKFKALPRKKQAFYLRICDVVGLGRLMAPACSLWMKHRKGVDLRKLFASAPKVLEVIDEFEK